MRFWSPLIAGDRGVAAGGGEVVTGKVRILFGYNHSAVSRKIACKFVALEFSHFSFRWYANTVVSAVMVGPRVGGALRAAVMVRERFEKR